MPRMFRQDNPVYRALVVEDERDFRENLILTIESMDIGITVVADTAYFDEAADIIDTMDIDLLITDINLSNEEAFNPGGEDGTVLGIKAYEKDRTPVVFLTAYGAPDIMEAAAQCNPVGFIQKTGESVGRQALALLTSAINRLEQTRKIEEYTSQLATVLSHVGKGILYLDRATQTVIDFNEEAAQVLGVAPEDLIDKPWNVALKTVGRKAQDALRDMLFTDVPTLLPPTALQIGHADDSVVVSGLVAPQMHRRVDCTMVILRELAHERIDSQPEIDGADSVLSVGVSGIAYGPTFGQEQLALMMLDVRTSLAHLLRKTDVLRTPEGPRIHVILKETPIEKAEGIARTAQGHLKAVIEQYGEATEHAWVAVGIAGRDDEEPTVQTLLNADDALEYAQAAKSNPVHVAGDKDRSLIAGNAAVAFTTGAPAGFYTDLLAGIVNLPAPAPSTASLISMLQAAVEPLIGTLDALHLFRPDNQGQMSCFASVGSSGPLRGLDAEVALEEETLKHIHGRSIEDAQSESVYSCGNIRVAVHPMIDSGELIGVVVFTLTEADTGSPTKWDPAVGRIIARQLAYILPTVQGWTLRLPPHSGAERAGGGDGQYHQDTTIRGYVTDSMEGAIEEARVISSWDIPIAVIGEGGTGKGYVAHVAHAAWGGDPNMIVTLECSSLGGREGSRRAVGKEIEQSANKTLVFKNPHKLHKETQETLARQLLTRQRSPAQPQHQLPRALYVGLFPAPLDVLVSRGELTTSLASAFLAHPIKVKPLRHRGRAIARWADKILLQESTLAAKRVDTFTADAYSAMLQHQWKGNLREMREKIRDAVRTARGHALSPIDLDIYHDPTEESSPLLESSGQPPSVQPIEMAAIYEPTPLDRMGEAIGIAIRQTLRSEAPRPIGVWLLDEAVCALLDRFSSSPRAASEAARLSGEEARNITRWTKKIAMRAPDRDNSALWQEPRRAINVWIAEMVSSGQGPGEEERMSVQLEDIVLSHLVKYEKSTNLDQRASVLGVSHPTFRKQQRAYNERNGLIYEEIEV